MSHGSWTHVCLCVCVSALECMPVWQQACVTACVYVCCYTCTMRRVCKTSCWALGEIQVSRAIRPLYTWFWYLGFPWARDSNRARAVSWVPSVLDLARHSAMALTPASHVDRKQWTQWYGLRTNQATLTNQQHTPFAPLGPSPFSSPAAD